MAERQQKGERTYHGIAVSAGVCRGKILVLHRTSHVIARRDLAENDVAAEVGRFEQALVQTRQQILEVQRRVLKDLSAAEADIFDAPSPSVTPRRWQARTMNISANAPQTCAI